MITRFSPSPTGILHLGNTRTALVSWILAKQTKNKFYLRYEDTDKVRSDIKYEENIKDSLDFLGVTYEPTVHRQTDQETDGVYSALLEPLIKKGICYYCNCTTTDLKAMKLHQIKTKSPRIGYTGICRDAGNTKGVLRFNPKKAAEVLGLSYVHFTDLIHGKRKVDVRDLVDVVLQRADGSSTYLLANTADDYLIGVNTVTRGFDLMPQTAIQVLLRLSLGGDAPNYCHLPLIAAQDGVKLSKRDSNTVSVIDYKNKGYLPDAISQYILNLSNDSISTDRAMTLSELIATFDVTKSRKRNSKYSEDSLLHLNKLHIRAKSPEEIQRIILNRYDVLISVQLIALYQERVETLIDFIDAHNKILDIPKDSLKLLQDSGFLESKCKVFREEYNFFGTAPLDSIFKLGELNEDYN